MEKEGGLLRGPEGLQDPEGTGMGIGWEEGKRRAGRLLSEGQVDY